MLRKMTAREFTTWSAYYSIKAEEEKRQALDQSVNSKLQSRREKGKAKP